MENFNEKITLGCYYEQLINVRNVEIDHFWKRILFLIGIQGVILSFFIGSFCALLASPYPTILIISSMFGLLLSATSFFIINTSRLWLEYYEEKVKTFEELINKMNNGSQITFDLFCDKEGRNTVKNNLLYMSTKNLCLIICFIYGLFWLFCIFYLISLI